MNDTLDLPNCQLLPLPSLDPLPSLAPLPSLDPRQWPRLVQGPAESCDVPFPVEALPPGLAAAVNAIAATFQVPTSLPACVMLGLAAGAVSGQAQVEVNLGWREHLVLWVACLMRPGTRKSPVFKLLHRSQLQLEESLREEHAKQVVAFHKQKSMPPAQDFPLALDLRLVDQAGDVALSPEVDHGHAPVLSVLSVPSSGVEGKVDEPPRSAPCLTVTDATPEAIVRLLGENNGRLTVASDEGVLFQHWAGLYRDGGANLDVFLKGWDGAAVNVHRAKGEPVYIPRALLTVVLAVQPVLLAMAKEERAIGGRGLLARLLWSVPHDGVGYRDVGAPALDTAALEAWEEAYRRVLLNPASDTPRILSLHPDARDCFHAWREKQEISRRPGGPFDASDTFRDWSTKADGAAVRIAGIFHMLSGSASDVIQEAQMSAGIKLMDYFAEHTRHALVLTGGDPIEALARRVLVWTKKDAALKAFTVREAHRQLSGLGLKAEQVLAGLRRLEERGHIREVVLPPAAKTGRPPSPTFEVRPPGTPDEPTEPTEPPQAPLLGSISTEDAEAARSATVYALVDPILRAVLSDLVEVRKRGCDAEALERAKRALVSISSGANGFAFPSRLAGERKRGRLYFLTVGGGFPQGIPRVVRHLIRAVDGREFVNFDFVSSHIAIAARFSGEEDLLRWSQEGILYDALATRYGVQRSDAKLACLATLNGASAITLVCDFNFTQENAALFVKNWWSALPRLQEWAERLRCEASRMGEITMPDGSTHAATDNNAVSTFLCVEEGRLLDLVMDRAEREIPGYRVALPMYDGALGEVPYGTGAAACARLRIIIAEVAGLGCTVGHGPDWATAEKKV